MSTDTNTNTETETRYYVVHERYCGPDPANHLDDEWYQVQTTPLVSSISGAIVTDEDLGVAGRFSSHGHGEFATLDEARAEIFEILCGEYRDAWPDGFPGDKNERGVVERYLVGRLYPMSPADSREYAQEDREKISDTTTDYQIFQIVIELERSAENLENAQLDTYAAREYLTERRDALRGDDNA